MFRTVDTVGVVDVEKLVVEGVGLLEALETRSVDQILNDVMFQQFSQPDGIVENGVQLGR